MPICSKILLSLLIKHLAITHTSSMCFCIAARRCFPPVSVAQCFHWCSLVYLLKDITRCEAKGLSFHFSVTQEPDSSLCRPTGSSMGKALQTIGLNFGMDYPDCLSDPKIRIIWEFNGKYAQYRGENLVI